MAETLLQMAIALLIAAQSPNIPDDLRFQATYVANTAIQYAQAQTMAKKEDKKVEPAVDQPYDGQFTPDEKTKPFSSPPKYVDR